MEKKSRRTFLKETAGAALGLSCGGSVLTSACSSSGEGSHGERIRRRASGPWSIDIPKAQNAAVRRACQDACVREHNIPRIDDPAEEDRLDLG